MSIADFDAREAIVARVHRALLDSLQAQIELRLHEAVRNALVALP